MSVRSYREGPRAYIDMDGVIADFEAVCKRLGKPPSEVKLLHWTYMMLEPIPGALDSMRELISMYEDRVFCLTKIPSQNPNAATQKLMWLNFHLPEIKDHVIITPDKGCVGRPIDLLIDDMPEWANAHKFPGTIIKYGVGQATWTGKLMDSVLRHMENPHA